MSSTPQASSSSSSSPNFQPILDKALKEYKKNTGKNLTTHPLAAEINGCESPDVILTVLRGKANELDCSCIGDERLTKWLTPTVNVLNGLSATLGQVVGSVSSSKSPHHLSVLQRHFSGFPRYQHHLFWNQHSPRSESYCAFSLHEL